MDISHARLLASHIKDGKYRLSTFTVVDGQVYLTSFIPVGEGIDRFPVRPFIQAKKALDDAGESNPALDEFLRKFPGNPHDAFRLIVDGLER